MMYCKDLSQPWLMAPFFLIRNNVVSFAVAAVLLLVLLRCVTTKSCGNDFVVGKDEQSKCVHLMKKAWGLVSCQGWPSHTVEKCRGFTMENVENKSTPMAQHCSGNSGFDTLHLILESFGGKDGINRYLHVIDKERFKDITLEQMSQLLHRLIQTDDGGNCVGSKWDNPSRKQISSIQVIGKGTKGFTSYNEFKAALRQLYHPTQPARIMALFRRDDTPPFPPNVNIFKFKLNALFGTEVCWSPILAYLEEEDLVLILDWIGVSGPKPCLLPAKQLYASINNETSIFWRKHNHGLLIIRPPAPKGQKALLTCPRDISVEFGKMKEAYYHHQAAGRKVLVTDILDETDENVFSPFLNESEQMKKCIRLLLANADEKSHHINGRNRMDNCADQSNLSAIISSHPVTFTNELYIPNKAAVDTKTVLPFVKVFSKLKVPVRVQLRGYDAHKANKIRDILFSVGMVQVKRANDVMVLNLVPEPPNNKLSKDFLPYGYKIIDIGNISNTNEKSKYVERVANLIISSYGYPNNITRYGQTTCEFLEQAYKTFEHNGNLKHFACIHGTSGEVVACAQSFCDRTGDMARSDIAGIFNVCTSPNHRRKGLGLVMTKRVIEEARKMQCKQVMLEATKVGRCLYESIGFTMIEEEAGGVYIMLSMTATSRIWKSVFKFVELLARIKNGGMWYYIPRRANAYNQ